MQNISKSEIQQAFGVMKTILVLVMYAIFFVFSYILIEKTDINTVFVIGFQTIIGTVLMGITFLGLKILAKIKLYLESKEKVSKEIQEQQEPVSISEEPKKKEKKIKKAIHKIIPKKKETVEGNLTKEDKKTSFGGSPKKEFEQHLEEIAKETIEEIIVEETETTPEDLPIPIPIQEPILSIDANTNAITTNPITESLPIEKEEDPPEKLPIEE